MSEINLNDILKVNQLVNIEVTDENGQITRYPSRIEDFLGDTVTLAAPIKNQQVVFLPQGTPLNIWIWFDDAVYVFGSIVLEATYKIIHQIIITKPEKIVRVQNREFVRVDYFLDVLFSYLNLNNEKQVIHCMSRDISGGGMLLVLNSFIPLEKGSQIGLQFSLENMQINVEGEIVWNEWKLDANGIEHNLLGIKFVNILESYRKIIIKSVFARQIELKRKGLL